MKLIIDIDDKVYNNLKNRGLTGMLTSEECECMNKSIYNGTPLPEKHGRLIDVNNIVYEKESIMQNDGCYTTVMIPNIDATPSIIEADKGE